MTLFKALQLGLQVAAGVEMLAKLGLPQVIRGVAWKGAKYKITIEVDR